MVPRTIAIPRRCEAGLNRLVSSSLKVIGSPSAGSLGGRGQKTKPKIPVEIKSYDLALSYASREAEARKKANTK